MHNLQTLLDMNKKDREFDMVHHRHKSQTFSVRSLNEVFLLGKSYTKAQLSF